MGMGPPRWLRGPCRPRCWRYPSCPPYRRHLRSWRRKAIVAAGLKRPMVCLPAGRPPCVNSPHCQRHTQAPRSRRQSCSSCHCSFLRKGCRVVRQPVQASDVPPDRPPNSTPKAPSRLPGPEGISGYRNGLHGCSHTVRPSRLQCRYTEMHALRRWRPARQCGWPLVKSWHAACIPSRPVLGRLTGAAP